MMYDLDKLRDELKQLEADIVQIDQVREERVKKRDECLQNIAGSEAILKLHGEPVNGGKN